MKPIELELNGADPITVQANQLSDNFAMHPKIVFASNPVITHSDAYTFVHIPTLTPMFDVDALVVPIDWHTAETFAKWLETCMDWNFSNSTGRTLPDNAKIGLAAYLVNPQGWQPAADDTGTEPAA